VGLRHSYKATTVYNVVQIILKVNEKSTGFDNNDNLCLCLLVCDIM
jgi:hypothetical protein